MFAPTLNFHENAGKFLLCIYGSKTFGMNSDVKSPWASFITSAFAGLLQRPLFYWLSVFLLAKIGSMCRKIRIIHTFKGSSPRRLIKKAKACFK